EDVAGSATPACPSNAVSARESAADELISKQVQPGSACVGSGAGARAVTPSGVGAVVGNEVPDGEEQIVNQGGVGQGEGDGTEEDSKRHLSFLFEALEEPALTEVLQKTPSLAQAVSRLLPFLTYGRVHTAQHLAEKFAQAVLWEDVVSDAMMEGVSGEVQQTLLGNPDPSSTLPSPAITRLRRQCFMDAAESMGTGRAVRVVRDSLLQNGFVAQAVDFVVQGVPASAPPPPSSAATAQAATSTSGLSWAAYFERPGLPRALRVLAGLCRGHAGVQGLLAERGLLEKLHWMEGTSTSGEVGLLAEMLLEAVTHDNSVTGAEVKRLRNETRSAKRKLAQARRDRALKSMRIGTSITGVGIAGPALGNSKGDQVDSSSPVNSGRAGGRSTKSSNSGDGGGGRGQVTVTSSAPTWMSEMMGLEEETGLTCMVCHEGYRCKVI
ncbi:unnamed protein product, partial [Choristocarpus tenellus]